MAAVSTNALTARCEIHVAQPFPPPLAASSGELRRDLAEARSAKAGRAAPAAVGRPKGLRYKRPPAISQRVLDRSWFSCFRVFVAVIAVLLASAAPRAAASRVISIIPATTEMLFAMGAGDRLVAVGSYDRFPPEVDRLPRVGALLDPNVERILALRPDLVILYGTQADLRQQLERAHVPYYPYVHRGLADITQTIRSLGARVGVEAAGNALADRIERQLADIRARAGSSARPKTLLVFGREPGHAPKHRRQRRRRFPPRHARDRRRRERPGGRQTAIGHAQHRAGAGACT